MRFRNQLNTERQKKRTNRGRVFRGRRRRRRRRTIGISSERQPRARAERITKKEKEDEQFEGGIVKAEIESDTERKREWERVQEAKAFLFLLS